MNSMIPKPIGVVEEMIATFNRDDEVDKSTKDTFTEKFMTADDIYDA